MNLLGKGETVQKAFISETIFSAAEGCHDHTKHTTKTANSYKYTLQTCVLGSAEKKMKRFKKNKVGNITANVLLVCARI